MQQVSLVPGGTYRVRLKIGAESHGGLKVRLCEQHLLYPFHCQSRLLAMPMLQGPGGRWFEVPLQGAAFASNGVLSITALDAKSIVHLQEVALIDPHGHQVLRNSAFSLGQRYWNSVVDANFLPWHMDNLFLELLIERGLLGLAVLAAVAACALVLGGVPVACVKKSTQP